MAGMTVTADHARQVLEALRQAGKEVNWGGIGGYKATGATAIDHRASQLP